MSVSDWRSPIPADPPATLGRPEFAAEFLRRNRHYRADYVQMARNIAAGAVSEDAARAALASRWGLSFRLRSNRRHRSDRLAR